MRKFYLSVLVVLLAVTGALFPEIVSANNSASISTSDGSISAKKNVEVSFDNALSFDRFEWFILVSRQNGNEVWARMQDETDRTLVLTMAKVLTLNSSEVTVRGKAWYGENFL